MSAPLYQVVDWDSYFENAKSRTYDKCAYLVSPNKHGGSGWSNVMAEPDGAATWGIWKMLLDLCSRQRKPRQGWLTDNGKKDGRRLSARELSNQFRRPIEEILRALQVLQSPEVAFMRLVDGQPEDTAVSDEGQSTDTAVSLDYPQTDRQATDTPRIPEGYSSNLSGDTLSKYTKKVTPIVPQGGQEIEGQEKDTPRISEGQSTDTAVSVEGQSTDTEEPLQYAEAQTLLSSLFPGCKKHLDGEEMHALSDNLPLPASTARLLSWAYTLPRDEEGWALHRGVKTSKPKQSRRKLLLELGDEVQKWVQVRSNLGLNGFVSAAKPEEPEPEGWRDAAFELYGESVMLPVFFREFSRSAQDEILAVLEKKNAGVGA